jgi:NOL1/NOP2/fmu family ribosome biogenesis protein
LQANGSKGWHLITVDGYSIGWGKLAGNMMKNHYPKGLRWMGNE